MPSIQLRHDTSTNWTTYNPVLLEGEVGIETDTNKVKIGDGTTTYNSLEYFVGDIDLSNYYNKTEVDGLLSEKQDVLTPDSPIYITSIVRPSNSGMTINSETNRAYSTNQIQMDVIGSTQVLRTYLSFTSQDFDYINEHFWDNGYIEVPYNLGQVVCGGSGIEGVIGANLDNFPNLIFGKYVGTNFVPIALYGSNRFYIYYSDTYTFTTGESTTSGISYLMNLGSDYYGDVPSTRTRILSPEYSRPYGYIGQIYIDPNNSTVTLSFGSNAYLSSETFSNQTVISRLNEVTTVRILPVWDSGNKSTTPLSTLNLGLYNLSTQITTTDLITENSLGTNLFDLQGETAQNYLGINIGSGLTIDNNGNLVNTNPTPVDLTNYYNKSEVDNLLDGKADTSDIPDVSDLATKSELNGKQDVLEAEAPINIAPTPSPLVNLQYTQDNTGLYSSVQDNTQYIDFNTPLAYLRTYKPSASSMDTESFFNAGYIEVPYNDKKTYVTTKRTPSRQGACGIPIIFGKYVNDEFIPVFFVGVPDGGGNYSKYVVNTTDSVSYQQQGDYWYANQSLYRNDISDNSFISGSNFNYDIALSLSFDNSQGTALISLLNNYSDDWEVKYADVTISDSTQVEALKSITTVRFCVGQYFGVNSTYPMTLDNIGIYDGYYTRSQLGDIRDIANFGTNELNLSEQNRLYLSIGTGLSVDGNGNLINTNPTPTDLSNYYTKTEIDNMIGNVETILHNINSGV